MPYRRRYRRAPYRRRYPRRNTRFSGRATGPWYSRKYSVADLARHAWKGVYYLKGLVNSETKKFDVVNDAITMGGGTLAPLTQVVQGDTDLTRDGNSIFARGLNLKMTFVKNDLGNDFQRQMIALVRDNQQISDTTPSFLDVFETQHPNTHLATDNVGRFSILKRYAWTFDDNRKSVQLNWNIPLRTHIRFNGAAGSDLQKGGYYLAYITDQDTDNFPTFSLHSRLSFHDN